MKLHDKIMESTISTPEQAMREMIQKEENKIIAKRIAQANVELWIEQIHSQAPEDRSLAATEYIQATENLRNWREREDPPTEFHNRFPPWGTKHYPKKFW